ncbi:MAG: nitrogen fixation protein NifH [Chloroflexi bacterium]|nr:nitrogen fixation protein NifH [Chloroflexota bacterium]
MAEPWKARLNNDPLPWLLEPDNDNPSVRYFALTDLLDRAKDDPQVVEARRALMTSGPVPAILAAQEPEGYWVKPGPGYNPKYRSTVWQVMFLAQLGADGDDPQVRAGCEYILTHSVANTGAFSVNGTPSEAIHCLGGNLSEALIDLGWLGDQRLDRALDWLARSVTGDGFASAEERDAPVRYYKSGVCGPVFRCAANNGLPCAWGAIKVMLALGKVSQHLRTPAVEAAIEAGASFLLSIDPAVADYPAGYADKPSASWFKFGFPIGYVTDVLQNLEALASLGYGADPRLQEAIDLVLSKQDKQGRWRLEYTYNGKTWADIERKGQPSKWVTLRALRLLKKIRSGS